MKKTPKCFFSIEPVGLSFLPKMPFGRGMGKWASSPLNIHRKREGLCLRQAVRLARKHQHDMVISQVVVVKGGRKVKNEWYISKDYPLGQPRWDWVDDYFTHQQEVDKNNRKIKTS